MGGQQSKPVTEKPNEIYRLTGNWVKQTTRTKGGGYSATYMTIQEDAKQQAKKQRSKQVAKSNVAETNGKPEDQPKKEPKDLPLIQCFRCKEYGHYSTSKDCKQQDSGFANASWQEEQAEGLFLPIQEEGKVETILKHHCIGHHTSANERLKEIRNSFLGPKGKNWISFMPFSCWRAKIYSLLSSS